MLHEDNVSKYKMLFHKHLISVVAALDAVCYTVFIFICHNHNVCGSSV